MKIVSWNVNGIRAAYKKGLAEFVERESPDLFCVQETKAHVEQCEPSIVKLGGMESVWAQAKRKGYSGVATFFKSRPLQITNQFGQTEYDDEGRVVISQHSQFSLYNIYFPNGGAGPERHQFKQKFLKDLYQHLAPKMKRGEPIIVVGDYNVAHREIDIYDPVRLATASGFLPEERAWMDGFLELGFVDTFREKHPHDRERYTWWSMVERGRMSNRGWRIDYICISKNLLPALKKAEVMDHVEGSDHCPVMIELEAQ